MIRHAELQDAAAIALIYNWYIEHTVITFEEQAVSSEEMAERIAGADEWYPWYVFEQQGSITGFAFATRFKPRSAYRHTVETTVYLDKDARGQGAGSLLYKHLIEHLRDTPIHVLVSAIALPNPQSIGLHEKLGYVNTGKLREVGRKFDQWIDVGYWQLTLDK